MSDAKPDIPLDTFVLLYMGMETKTWIKFDTRFWLMTTLFARDNKLVESKAHPRRILPEDTLREAEECAMKDEMAVVPVYDESLTLTQKNQMRDWFFFWAWEGWHPDIEHEGYTEEWQVRHAVMAYHYKTHLRSYADPDLTLNDKNEK